MKSIAVVIAALLALGDANAYLTVNDRNSFAAQYEKPTHRIDFSALKDGTVFSEPTNTLNSSLITTTSGHAANVRAEGWSNDLLIGSTDRNGGWWSAATWLGGYISPAGYGFFNSIYLDTGLQGKVVSLETSIGFLGLIPDSPSDSLYILPNYVSVRSIKYGYSEVTAVPEIETYAMLLSGLGVIGALVRRRKGKQA